MQKIVLCCCLLSSLLFADIDTRQVLGVGSGVLLPIPDEELQSEWMLGYRGRTQDGSWVAEWLPRGESVEQWSKLIQIQYLSAPTGEISKGSFVRNYLGSLKGRFPSLSSRIVSTEPDKVVLEWSLPVANHSQAPQNELNAILEGEDGGIYRIAFTRKLAEMEEPLRVLWLDRLARSRLVP